MRWNKLPNLVPSIPDGAGPEAHVISDDKSPFGSLVRFELGRRAGKDGAALMAFKTAELTLRMLRDYHRHTVIGLENLPRTGPALVVFNHSFATYDGFLPVVAVFDEIDRLMWGVADRLVFRTPGLGDFSRKAGYSPGAIPGMPGSWATRMHMPLLEGVGQ